MKRKIIKQGHNTLTITLPSKWAKRFNLQAGEEINLIERENGLFFSSEKIDKPSEITIDITGLNVLLIWKHVNTAYRAGYNKIIVKFSPDELFDSPYKYFAHYILDPTFTKNKNLTPVELVHQISARQIGFEVIEYGKDFCILQEIGQSTSKEFDSSLRRIFLLLLHMSEGIINDLEKGKISFLEKVHNVDVEIDKFHDFCARVLNKTGIEEPSKSSLTFTLIFLLELVGDEFKHLAIQLIKKDPKKSNSKKFISLLNLINEQTNLLYELYYKYDREKLKTLFNLNKEFSEKASSNANGYKEDIQVTIESINRYMDALSEVLIATKT